MMFTKRFEVGVRCVCGAKLDAVLCYEGEKDFIVEVDNTHVCSGKIKGTNELSCDCDLRSSESSNRHEVFCSLYQNARLGDG